MQCVSPLSLPRPNGRGSADRITVPCGKCVYCLSNRRQMWAFRIEQELKVSTSAFFITLTYEDKNLPKQDNIPVVCKDDIQKFLKRLRKECAGSKIRYFLVSEYGPENKRPHYHGIFFNLPIPKDDEFNTDLVTTLLKCWQKGFVHVGTCTPASISYCAKYCITKTDFPTGALPPFLYVRLGLEKITSLMLSGYTMKRPATSMQPCLMARN